MDPCYMRPRWGESWWVFSVAVCRSSWWLDKNTVNSLVFCLTKGCVLYWEGVFSIEGFVQIIVIRFGLRVTVMSRECLLLRMSIWRELNVILINEFYTQVTKVQVKDKVPQFLVHYSGWNKTWETIIFICMSFLDDNSLTFSFNFEFVSICISVFCIILWV